MSILLADSVPESREAIAWLLRSDRYRVVAVGTGVEAVSALVELQPSLVIVDLEMPFPRGGHVFDGMKRAKRFAETPVFAISRRPMPGLDAPVWTRPVDHASLLDAVARAVPERDLTRPRGVRVPSSDGSQR